MHRFLAVDLGAESGRVVLGSLGSGRLRLEELARFRTGMVRLHGRLHWNVFRMLEELVQAFRSASETCGKAESVGVDSWGVDFALLAEDGSVLGMPVAYRDARTDGMMERVFERVPRETIYQKTGIQFTQINTLYQLFALVAENSPLLSAASDLLFIPDLFHYFLAGEKRTEFTDATTSQLLNVHRSDWDRELLEAVGIRPSLFQEVVPPGTVLGRLTTEIQEATGLPPLTVLAPATHDTASAVAAVPAEGDDWAYISSGTWSLMGLENPAPICSDQARQFNFTNEGGVEGTYRFLKNIMGLWLVQRCRAGFDRPYDYAELVSMAEKAPPFACLVDTDDTRFLNPPSMPEAIGAFCRETHQPEPRSPGEFIRCALESLALEYRTVLEELRRVCNRDIRRIHVVGGGAQNKLLCRMTADATRLPVIAGPVEATAIGNLLVQARALGCVQSFEEARTCVRRSFQPETFEPREPEAWDNAWEQYMSLKAGR